MKLSDVMSAMHMTIFAEVPLLIFLGVFIGVAIHLLQGKEPFEEMRMLPLEHDEANEGREP
jgi:hypothetical protein